MNDPEEYLFGRRAFARAFSLRANYFGDRLHEQVADYLEAIEGDSASAGYDTYFTCFSELSDDLSQWRAYGDDGRGVSITFRTDQLETEGSLLPVLYGIQGKRILPPDEDLESNAQKELIHCVIMKATQGVSKMHMEVDLRKSIRPDILSNLQKATEGPISMRDYQLIRRMLFAIEPEASPQLEQDVLSVISALPAAFVALKDSDFAAEREFRLAISRKSNKVRLTGGFPKPYCPIPYSPSLLPTTITLGPLASDDLTKTAIRRFVRDRLGRGIQVVTSRISYHPV
ncbi:hypothetical protein BH11ARM2_BH11ARM2_23590 [soil metagenome]